MNELITLFIMIMAVSMVLSVYALWQIFYQKAILKSKKTISQIIDEI